MSSLTRTTAALALVALLVVGAVAPAAAAGGAINYGADQAPDVFYRADTTKAEHDMTWGTSDDAARYIENDNGELVKLDGEVNTSADNPYSFLATDINFTDARRFPGGEVDSAVENDSSWTTDTSSSAGSMTVSDVETVSGVEAVEIATSSQTGGDTAFATFDSNVSVTADVDKRYLQLAYTVDTLDSGALVDVRAVDSDGDYVNATIEPDDSSGENFMTNQTGEGFVFQRQMGQMTVYGTGDGTMQEIQKLEVYVEDGNADVDFMAINAEKKGQWDFGEKMVDSDGDGEKDETATHTEVKTPGKISVHSLDTLGGTFDSATLHDVTQPMLYSVKYVEDTDDVDNVNLSWESADAYPSFDWTLDAKYRVELPDFYDVSHANAELVMEGFVPSSRIEVAEQAEGVGETDFDDISDGSYSSFASSAPSVGNEYVIDSTIQAGQPTAIHLEILYTDDEKQTLEQMGGGGAVGPLGGGGGGGILGFLTSLPGMAISAVVGLLGARRFGLI